MAEVIFNTDHFIVFAHNDSKILAVDGMTYAFNSNDNAYGNTVNIYDYITGVEGLGEWEEIPILKPNIRGLLQATDNGFESLGVQAPYLRIGKDDEDNNELQANASDRCTPYENHRLYATIEGVDYELWCPTDWEYIVDGSTVVYMDESCTDPIGIIADHNYNPNNPYDTEIDTGGDETFVFTWDTKDYPETLATTLAVIDAVEEAVKKKTSIAGTAVYCKPNGSGQWAQVTVTWSSDHYVCSPPTMAGFLVGVTADGNAPANDLSNVTAYFQWTAGTSFGIVAIVAFTDDGTHGDAPIQILL